MVVSNPIYAVVCDNKGSDDTKVEACNETEDSGEMNTFDLATPFYEGIYEMQHLQISAALQNNTEFKFYESGHMVYAHQASLK
jgi:carboxypeptidase C (cathepsin A)